MKSKAKLNKIKNANTANTVKRNLPHGWIIMAREEITVADIKTIIGDSDDIEIWPEVGVLEITIGEKSSVDIEAFDADPRDEYSCEYITKNGIKELFYVTFKAEDYDAAEVILKKIAAGIDGFICGDTDDFTPVIK